MVALASEFFHECFRDKIKALVTAYPEDHVTEVCVRTPALRLSTTFRALPLPPSDLTDAHLLPT